MSLYRGFSTVDRNYKFRLTDFDAAKQDLINHLHIAKGEKLMSPSFGTSIWLMLFDNMTEDMKKEIADEIIRVVNYDPRLSLKSIDVIEYEHGIQVQLDVLYTGSVTPVTLRLGFERDTQKVTEL